MWPHICLSQHHGRRSREVAFGMVGKWVKQCLLGKEQGRDAGLEGRSLSHPRLLSDKGPVPGKDSVCVLQRAGETEQKVMGLWKSIHHSGPCFGSLLGLVGSTLY